MTNQIRRWLTPPQFPGDEPKTRRAGLLYVSLLLALSVILFVIVGIVLGGHTPLLTVGIDVFLAAAGLLTLYAIRRGHVMAASVIFLLLGMISVTAAAASLGTIRTPTTTIYLLLVIVAGMLFDLAGLLVLTVLSSLAVLGLIIAENADRLPAPDYAVTITQWLMYTALFGAMGLLTYVALNSTRRALQRADAELADRKLATAALQAGERRLQAITDTANDAIIVADKQGRIIAWNQGACLIFGYATAEALGKSLSMLMPASYRQAHLTGMLSFFEAQTQVPHIVGQTVELVGRRKDGSEFPLELSLSTGLDNGELFFTGIIRDITARKRTEQEWRKLLRAVEQSPVTIVITNTAGEIEYVNPKFVQTTGYTLAEARGQNPRLLKSGHTSAQEYQRLWETIAAGGEWRGEFHNKKKNGDLYWETATIGPVWNERGDITHFVAVKEDITDQRRTEEALRESQLLYHSLVEVSPMSICRKDRAGRFTFANRRFLEASNRTLADLVGKTDFDLHPPELAAKYQKDDRAVMDSGQVWEIIEPREVEGDKPIVVQTIKAPLYDGAGNINGVQISFWDITDHQRAEEALRESEARFHAMFTKHAAVMLLIEPATSAILDANFAAEKFYGYPIARLCAMNLAELNTLTPEQIQLERQRAQREERNYDIFPHRLANGDIRLVEVHSSPIELDNQSVLFSIIHDITEQQQAEAALRASHAKLQTRNEELDAYAHTVAHDLKNPLSIVVGYAEVLLSYSHLPDEARQFLLAISRSGQKASDIIESLLLLASIRQQDVRPMPLDMAHIIDDVLQRLAESIRENGADLRIPDRASWPSALGYAPWIEEIWVNYLSNAIKYGGPQPRIELDAVCQPDGFIRFCVRDYGPGLTAEQQQRLFAPFERLEQTRVTGHGLGLSVVRRIAGKLGGEVGVQSSGVPGEGCTFYFTLPTAPSA